MSSMALPQQFTLPPIGVTVTASGQIQVEWQQAAAVADATLPQAARDSLAAAVLRGEDDATALRSTGLAAVPAVLAALGEYRAHPLARIAREKLLKLESHARIDAQLARLHPARQAVDRREALSAEAFLAEYYAANRPVVLTGRMHNWRALTRWTPEFFAERFGAVDVQVQKGREGSDDYEVNMHLLRHTMSFGDYVRQVETSGPSNDYYLVASNHVLHETALGGLMEDVELFPDLMRPDAFGSVFFWYGPAGTVTPLHHDPSNIILAQVRGRKKVLMYPPVQSPLVANDFGVYSRANPENVSASPPEFAHATPLETTLGPGEALFIPVGWWHHVRSLDVAVSVSTTAFRFDNAFEWHYPNHAQRPRREASNRY